jgi:hypothetical protein
VILNQANSQVFLIFTERYILTPSPASCLPSPQLITPVRNPEQNLQNSQKCVIKNSLLSFKKKSYWTGGAKLACCQYSSHLDNTLSTPDKHPHLRVLIFIQPTMNKHSLDNVYTIAEKRKGIYLSKVPRRFPVLMHIYNL